MSHFHTIESCIDAAAALPAGLALQQRQSNKHECEWHARREGHTLYVRVCVCMYACVSSCVMLLQFVCCSFCLFHLSFFLCLCLCLGVFFTPLNEPINKRGRKGRRNTNNKEQGGEREHATRDERVARVHTEAPFRPLERGESFILDDG